MKTDSSPRSSLAMWLGPVVAFLVGVFATYMLMASPPSAVPEPDPAVPMFGAAAPAAPAPAPSTAVSNSAAQAELALMRDINTRFIDQLRDYEDRMRTIATAADGEGASGAASDLRDFANETKALIDRYDLILKNN